MPEPLTIGAGIARGFEGAVTNLTNIMQARRELEMEHEKFDLDKKIKNLEIKKAEYELDPETIRLERDKLKREVDVEKADYNLKLLEINKAEAEERRELEKHEAGMELIERLRLGIPGAAEPDVTEPGAEAEPSDVISGIRPDLREEPPEPGFELPRGFSLEYEVGETPKIKYKTPKEEDVYKDTAEWKKKDAQSTLMREFLTTQREAAPEEVGLEKLPFISSKREVAIAALKGEKAYRTKKGKLDTAKIFNKLGLTIDDFYTWALENYPDLARIAFPGRTILEKK